ncbi:hypothetical protein AAG906_023774 [Vitis piasezkii]
MDCVSPILDVATRLWDCTTKRAVYIGDLQEILESLSKAMEELKNMAEDVKVELAEKNRQMRRTREVDGWLQSVQVLEKQVDEILQKGNQEIQRKCLGSCCPKNCRSSYKIGKIASKKLGARPMEKTVGLDLMYAEVCRCIQDEQLGIIGLYGMGFFKTSNDFEVVIWVVVSSSANVGKVQEVIRNKLDIPDDRWRNRAEDEKAVEIFNTLKAKRFVMLLDDVWEQLDLQKLGVPSPNSQNKSKVILTTRSQDVCHDMEAQKSIKVECLTQDEAINLFKKKVGESTLCSHPDIPKLAEIAAKECKGLPLALITIGRAMAGMGDHVFPVLKFSYDSLQNGTLRSCFLYLAVFQEDYVIIDNDLINLWIGEGFLDEFDNLHEARNQGHNIIEHLKVACLFESDEDNRIKMHDVIRDMALWLTSEYCGNKNKIVVEKMVLWKLSKF